mgnify:CR=1 FL=1
MSPAKVVDGVEEFLLKLVSKDTNQYPGVASFCATKSSTLKYPLESVVTLIPADPVTPPFGPLVIFVI